MYTIVKNPIVTINPTQVTICETETFTVPASYVTVVNPSSILSYQWTTTNMSSLIGANTWTPTYTPTAADINATFVNLTLTVSPIAPCAAPIVRNFKINIVKKATINATQTNYTFCENTPKQLSAVFANHDATTILWNIVSGGGTLLPANNASPTFTPDASSTTVVIEVSVSSNSPCTAVETKQFTLNGIKKPVVSFANTSATICNSQTSYPLNATTVAATVANATASTTYLWTTTGTGTFSNNTALLTTYNFSAADLLLNTVKLKLTAVTDNECEVVAFPTMSDYEEIEINIRKAPIATTTPTDIICEGSVFTAIANATNESSVLWTNANAASNGVFITANEETAQYIPGSDDINGFTLIFTAFGDPVSVCTTPATATKLVTVQKKPEINIGINTFTN